MFRLIRAGAARTFTSHDTFITLSLCLVFGMIGGVKSHSYIYGLYDIYMSFPYMDNPTDSFWIKCCLWLTVVCVSMNAGVEYSGGVIKNKLISGHTKAGVLFSEMVIAVLEAAACFALSTIPILIGGKEFFFTMSASSLTALMLELFLCFVVWEVFSSALTLLIGSKIGGVVLAFSLMIIGAIVNFSLKPYYTYNTTPKTAYEDMEYYEIQSNYELEGLPREIVIIEHEISPFSALDNICNYCFIHHPEKADAQMIKACEDKNRQITHDCIVLATLCAGMLIISSVIFTKKDIK